MKKLFFITVLLASFISLSSCGSSPEKGGTQERLVSLSPNITELLFALGLGEKVAGVTSYCDYPAQCREKQSVGSIMEPDIETVISLSPDTVFISNTEIHRRIGSRLEGIGAETVIVETKNIDDIYSAIDKISRICGVEQRGSALKAQIRKKLSEIRSLSSGGAAPKVLVVVQREPIMAAGKGTYIDSLLEIAGAENAAEQGGYPKYNAESLVVMNPDIIIESDAKTDGIKKLEKQNYYSRWKTNAAEEGNVYQVNADVVSRLGPRITKAAKLLRSIVKQSEKGKKFAGD
ncbi:heme/hemin ABC transporter substrate-binding protein [Sedimentisphaera salicampi]|uniref:heme/hemin ABC transporter substrate-binding protein n=1 Tax=Sedimentisphaera salicampi TaxID=1941349 RepID=UPI000B9BD545|nr:helical backbone metal receptor [Sedimentisphaera salicampi]OXU13986.1 Vitamin B12-binding protein precursor [Sedimentisphaera salicampi]